jgi:polyferredoxin
MLMALAPLLYFFPPRVVWSFISFRVDPDLPASMYWIYTVFVLICLLDITVLRHFWCRFICIYRVWQHSFKTRQTLHIAYDASRSADCLGCDYCVTQCFLELDPRSTDVFDSCINCGECVDACTRMHQKKNQPGLLRFEFGQRTVSRTVSGAANTAARHNNEYSLLGRVRWTLPFSMLGVAMFAWGLWSYQPYHLAIDHDRAAALESASQYQIALTNKRYQAGDIHLSVSGLANTDYHLEQSDLHLLGTEHQVVHLIISQHLSHGLHRFIIHAQSPDGWHDDIPVQHLASD